MVLLVNLFFNWLRNNQRSYHLLVNIRRSSSYLEYYSTLVISTGKIIITSLGVTPSKLGLDTVIFISSIDGVLAY